VRLESTTGGASKFWEAEVIGNQTTLRFGKIGTAGQTQVKTYGSAAEAQAAVAKATQKKLADGYSADAFTSAAGGATATSGVTSAATGPKPHAVAGLMVAAKLPLGERQTFAFYLNRILDTFGAFEAAVDAHQNPEPGTRFAFSREIKPEVKAEIAARHASVVSSLHGPYEGSRAPTEANAPSEAALAELGAWLQDLLAWQGQLQIGAFALGFDSPQDSLAQATKSAIQALPRLPAAGLTQRSAAQFAKLSESETLAVFAAPDTYGYQVDRLDDGPAAKLVKKLIGPERTQALLDQVKAAAELDVGSDADGKPGKPTISSVDVLRSGGEVVGYKVTAHCNAQPSDNDLLVDWMLDAKGRLLAEDTR
jgi:predicted DNA-binding WGR domain protein